ncbi:MAG: hypothetical protein AAFR47_04560 [Pseudomonadota bacterium]
MSDIRRDLKEHFDDGSIPRGQDFGDLIDSFALDAEFKKHEDDFTAFLPDGHAAIVLARDGGAGPVTWEIRSKERGELSFTQTQESALQDAPTVKLAAWTGLEARFGLWKSGEENVDEEEQKTLGEPSRSMSFVGADKTWHTIIPTQEGAFAAEIVAYAGGTPTTTPAPTLLSDFFGRHKPSEGVCHATLVCRGKGQRPVIRIVGDPFVPAWLQRWPTVLHPWALAAEALVALLLVATMISTRTAEQLLAFIWCVLTGGSTCAFPAFAPPALGPEFIFFATLTILALLWLIRTFNRVSGRRRGPLLRWVRTSGSPGSSNATHALQIRAGPYDSVEKPRIRYHITRLWG